MEDKVLEFWNSRAGLGFKAGTNDVNLKKLEMSIISKYVKDGMKVLDIGGGNGVTAFHLAENFGIEIDCFDFADEMIAEAKKNYVLTKNNKNNLNFYVDDVTKLHNTKGDYDLIYTERVLINLDSWQVQSMAIDNILKLLRPKGLFLMCENVQDGLNNLNELRSAIGLEPITRPWHNRYFLEKELLEYKPHNAILENVECFTSTYYFISRVINAWQSINIGEQPSYEAPVNSLAFKLPIIGDFGQTKLWVWRKQ